MQNIFKNVKNVQIYDAHTPFLDEFGYVNRKCFQLNNEHLNEQYAQDYVKVCVLAARDMERYAAGQKKVALEHHLLGGLINLIN